MNKQYYCKTSTTAITKIVKRKNRNTKTKLSYDLSETDIKIINLICDEYNSEEIGRLLFLSKRTIDGARLRIHNVRVKMSYLPWSLGFLNLKNLIYLFVKNNPKLT
jgi:DNA-binding CsgD family transcriptional regulator